MAALHPPANGGQTPLPAAESAERDPSARETLTTQQVQRKCVVETQGVFYCHYVINVTIYL
jgi:hypothetical protein